MASVIFSGGKMRLLFEKLRYLFHRGACSSSKKKENMGPRQKFLTHKTYDRDVK